MAKRPLVEAEKRDVRGSRAAARLRKSGVVPAVMYGGASEGQMLTVSQERLREIIESRSRMVDINIDGKSQPAMLKEVQYDHLGSDIYHADFELINLTENVRIAVPIETHGSAKGAKAGGVLEIVHKHLNIECKADDIPNEIVVEIADLDLGQAITVADLKVPQGVKVLDDRGVVVIIVQAPRKAEEEPAEAVEGVELSEPEVIGARKDKEEEAEEEEK